MAGIKGPAFSYLGEFHSNKNRPKYLAFLSSFLPFGSFVQPIIGLAIMTRHFDLPFGKYFSLRPWRVFIMAAATFSATVSFALQLLPESPKFLLATKRKE